MAGGGRELLLLSSALPSLLQLLASSEAEVGSSSWQSGPALNSLREIFALSSPQLQAKILCSLAEMLEQPGPSSEGPCALATAAGGELAASCQNGAAAEPLGHALNSLAASLLRGSARLGQVGAANVGAARKLYVVPYV